MKPILTDKEELLLIDAIRQQELRTSAEIRVCLTYKLIWRPERYAWKVFDQAGMRATVERNGVLIVMMPRMKKVVVIGDTGVDALVPQGIWREIVTAMIHEMHETDALTALREGLRRVGDALAPLWPRRLEDLNELPDEILP